MLKISRAISGTGLTKLQTGKLRVALIIFTAYKLLSTTAVRRAIAAEKENGRRDGGSRPLHPEVSENITGVKNREDVVVYTAVFGNYDTVSPAPLHLDWDCILFTDNAEIYAPGWQVIALENQDLIGLKKNESRNRLLKIRGHEVVNRYQYSLYVDGNLDLSGNIRFVYTRYLAGENFVMMPHPRRDCAFDEISYLLLNGRKGLNKRIAQWRQLTSSSLPRNFGLAEARFIWRNNASKAVKEIMENWWQIYQTTMDRDQPGLPLALFEAGSAFSVLPERYGTARKNVLYAVNPHKRSTRPLTKIDSRLASARQTRGVGNRRDLYFATSSAGEGRHFSEVMRTEGLSNIIEKFDRKNAPACRPVSDLLSVRDSAIFLNKRVLMGVSPKTLDHLGKHGNILIADYIDGKEKPELRDHIDFYMASSIGQLHSYRQQFGADNTSLVTHHASSFPAGQPEMKQESRALYFGEPLNGAFLESLQDLVETVPTSHHAHMEKADNRWFFHYVIRQTRGIDSFKPFTKGFYAAAANALVIEVALNSEALWYLTPDYPFLANDGRLSTIRAVIEKANAASGPELKMAKDIMQEVKYRSSPRSIYREFLVLLDMID